MTLQLNVLGGLSLCRGDQPMAGAAAQRKPLALLAVIERAGARGISRERLLSLFAPESDEERARGVLKQLLYALRKDSGEATLVDGVATLILNSEIVQCDLRQFEAHCAAGAWQQAVEAYGGPFLDGIHLAGAPEFEEWADQHRRVAAGLYRKALLERAQAEDLAVPGGGEWWWSRVSGLDPLDAGGITGWMRSLAAGGKRAAALQVAHGYEERAREELGLEAEESVRTLKAEIERIGSHPSPPPLEGIAEAPVARATGAGRRRRRGLSIAAVALLAMLGVVSATGAWQPRAHPTAVAGRTIPLSAVADFTNQTGIDSLGFLGTIIGDRIALDLGARGIARSRRPSETARSAETPDLGIGGGYFTAGDTLFVAAEVKLNGTRYDLFEIPLLTGSVGSVNTMVDSLVARISLGVSRQQAAIRREWAFDTTEGLNPKALLWFAAATRSYRGDLRCEERLDMLDSATATDPHLIQALLYHAELGPWCVGSLGDHQRDRLAKVRARLRRRQAGQTPFTSAYIDFLLVPDSAAKLHAARSMLVAAPRSVLALNRLVRTLADFNQYGEVLRVTQEFQSRNGEFPWAVEYEPLPSGLQAYADALHLAGRYRDEASVAEALRPRLPSLGESVRLRAMAALHQPIDMRAAALQLSGTYTLEGNLLLLLGDELAAHGYHDLADSLALAFRNHSCEQLENSWRSKVGVPPERATRIPASWEDRLRLQGQLLESVERSLRYGCIDDASDGLDNLGTPIADSAHFLAVKGELAASRGDSAVADSAIAWLQQRGGGTDQRFPAPWFAGYRRARIAARLGRRDQAFRLLSAAIEGGMPLTMDLHTDPLWRSFAADPMFRAAIGR